MLIAQILMTVADLALAILLIGVSGFIFGGGPEGANGEATAVTLWCMGFASCLAAPVAGFVARARGLAGFGLLIAAAPPVVGLLFSMI